MLKIILILSVCYVHIYAKLMPGEVTEDGFIYINGRRADVQEGIRFSMKEIQDRDPARRVTYLRTLFAELKNDNGDVYRMVLAVDSELCKDNKRICTDWEKRVTDFFVVLIRKVDGVFTYLKHDIPVLHTLMFYPNGCNSTLRNTGNTRR